MRYLSVSRVKPRRASTYRGFADGPAGRRWVLDRQDLFRSDSNQNFAALDILPPITATVQSTNLMLNWQGIPGVSYQVFYSTDLVHWLPYGGRFTGTNGPMGISLPVAINAGMFFRLRAGP